MHMCVRSIRIFLFDNFTFYYHGIKWFWYFFNVSLECSVSTKKSVLFLLPHSAWAKAVAMSLHNNSTAAAAAVAIWLTHRAQTIWASKVRVHVAFFYSLHDRAFAATVVVSVKPNTEHCMDWPTSCSRKFASNSRISN